MSIQTLRQEIEDIMAETAPKTLTVDQITARSKITAQPSRVHNVLLGMQKRRAATFLPNGRWGLQVLRKEPTEKKTGRQTQTPKEEAKAFLLRLADSFDQVADDIRWAVNAMETAE